MKVRELSLITALMTVVMPLEIRAEPEEQTKKNKKAEMISQFTEISVSDLQAKIKDAKVTVIDCNNVKSYNSGHIPGALHFGTVKAKIEDVLPADKSALIVTYCGAPNCVAWLKAAVATKKLGYTNVQYLKVGISGWKEAKGDLEEATSEN